MTVSSLGVAAPALAQAPQAAVEEADTIIVTGTRARDRTVLDSPVPVDVLSSAALTQAGSSGEVAQALQNLTPSFNFPRQSNSGAGDTVRAAQLRGLSPDQTLVLVNGKRYHTTATPNLDTKVGRGTAPVDFNTLPLNAIGRIEILRDGAGAQYGSDAIAGVINIQLDRVKDGGSIGVTYGLNVTKPGVIGEQIEDGQTALVEGKFGTTLANGGFISVGGDYLFQQGTNRAGFDQGGNFLTNGSYSDPRNFPFFGQRLFKVGDPRVEGGHLWFNSELPLGDATFYAFGIGHTRKAIGANFFRWPVIVDGNGNDYLPPNLPDGLNGFRPKSNIRNSDLSLTAGVKGEAGGWALDGSLSFGSNWLTYRLTDSINYSLGSQSPNAFLLSKARSNQFLVNLDANREFDVGMAGPMTVAFGAEYRRHSWKSTAGDPASYAVGPLADPASLGLQPGAQAGPGLTPDDARSLNRDVVGGYVDLSLEPVQTLFLNVAGRVEHYNDAGTSVAGKGAARWEFAPGFAVRGSVSNSFKAPALAQLGASSTSLTFGAGGQLRRVSTLPVDSAAARALGAKPLDPEKSFNLSGGLTANAGGFRLSVDAFRILIDNRITLSERFDLSGLTPAQRTALGLGTFDAINFFTNAVDLKTEGYEIVAGYAFEFEGKWDLSAAYSYAKNSIRRVAPPPPQLAANGISGGLIGLEERNTLTTAAPRNKLILGVNWSNDRWSSSWRGTRYGGITRQFDFGGGFTPRQDFGAEWQVDGEVAVKILPALSLAVGVNNLFDNYPAPSIDDINGAGNLAYDILSPIGINGRYLYAKARFDF
ncbi:TonB-dependent receptor plug domain-containing protein [Sandaracinobacteroides saxicola]|uniref:TonB-dependent receptor n=1 Tax=Sandaracinobacteroides saxicola TaxID=2759707 RepID=A0A7G5ILR1_9SPHN|nr:TonB-dependent receptor [Sandaracinobacteroides saxicola]QMW24303.1 TonB-dependent receptor [Sandaracinobacteroides saxicola]